MPNEKRRKSVEEIIAKYGVQSISTDAVNDIPVDEEFIRPGHAAKNRKNSSLHFRNEAKPHDLEDTQEIDVTAQEQTDRQQYASQFRLPENYDAEPVYSEDGETVEDGFLPENDEYIIPNFTDGTAALQDRYRDELDFEIPSYEEEEPDYDDSRRQVKRQNWMIRFLRFFIPWKGDGIGEIIRKIIFIVAFITLIVSGSILIPTLYEDWKAGKTDQQVAALYHNGSDEEKIKQAETILGKALPDGILPEFALLYANNQEITGWVTIPDTLVDYPIAKAQDNQYYLSHDYYKNQTRYGVPFMDFNCAVQPLGENTVVYGHHMNNGTVFSGLDVYRTLEGYQKHPVVTFNTIYERHQWKVIGAFITNSEAKDDNGYYFDYTVKNFLDEADFNGYLQGVKERSFFSTNVDVTYGDKLLTLQTCNYEFNNARLIVVARMVRDGEDAAVDVSGVQTNPNPRYPQAYYNKKGIMNPFSTGGWIPGTGEQPTTTTTAPETTTALEITTALNTTTTVAATRPVTTAPRTTDPTTSKPTITTTKPITSKPITDPITEPSTEPPTSEPEPIENPTEKPTVPPEPSQPEESVEVMD